MLSFSLKQFIVNWKSKIKSSFFNFRCHIKEKNCLNWNDLVLATILNNDFCPFLNLTNQLPSSSMMINDFFQFSHLHSQLKVMLRFIFSWSLAFIDCSLQHIYCKYILMKRDRSRDSGNDFRFPKIGSDNSHFSFILFLSPHISHVLMYNELVK